VRVSVQRQLDARVNQGAPEPRRLGVGDLAKASGEVFVAHGPVIVPGRSAGQPGDEGLAVFALLWNDHSS